MLPHLLCESCGYGLFGLSIDATCPECGASIAESLPHHRDGPAWQNRYSLRSWCATAGAILARPGAAFRAMRLDGTNWPSRWFLLSMASVTGVVWGLFNFALMDRGGLMSWLLGMVAAKAVLLMSYVEAVGVTFFSRRRGWRVPFGLAERVTGYASVGWVIAAVVLGGLSLLTGNGRAEAWVGRLFPDFFEPDLRLLLGAAGLGAAVMGFEVLVWTGVRRVRFGNTG